MASVMAEVEAQSGKGHVTAASTPSWPKVNDLLVVHIGTTQVIGSALFILNTGYDLKGKTSGWIESDAEPGVRKCARSGWKKQPIPVNMILDSEVYTARVQELAEAWGFYIPPHRFDNGWKRALPAQVGRFNASHIEKKLSLWWVERVLWFFLKTKDLKRMHELREFKLPQRMARATVVLNHSPCQNCLEFLDEIYRITGIRITTREIPLLEVTTRTRIDTFPDDDDCEETGDEHGDDENDPQTPRPTLLRKESNPKALKELTFSSPPPTWMPCANGGPGAKPISKKASLEEERQMHGGFLPSYQHAKIICLGEDKPQSSQQGSQSHDGELADNQDIFEDGDQSPANESPSTSPSPSPPPRQLLTRPSAPFSQIQVQLPRMNANKRAEYQRIEASPVTPRQSSTRLQPSSPALAPVSSPDALTCTTPAPRSGLNLQHYVYRGGVVTPAKRPARIQPRKPKGPTRAEKMIKKSTFLRAAERAERQRAQVQDGLGVRAQMPVPGLGAGADDGDDGFLTRVHPGFLASFGGDMEVD